MGRTESAPVLSDRKDVSQFFQGFGGVSIYSTKILHCYINYSFTLTSLSYSESQVLTKRMTPLILIVVFSA